MTWDESDNLQDYIRTSWETSSWAKNRFQMASIKSEGFHSVHQGLEKRELGMRYLGDEGVAS